MTAHTDEHLIDVQLRLESEMTKRGIDRYMRTVAEAKADGGEDKLAAAQTLMQHHTARPRRAAPATTTWRTST
jgi:hypothetical protein